MELQETKYVFLHPTLKIYNLQLSNLGVDEGTAKDNRQEH